MTSALARTPFSVLDLAPVRHGGSAAQSFRNTLELARHAEKWGYHRFWLAEHHNISGVACSATSVLIGFVAGNTNTIRVGSGGVMLPNHAPLTIAEQFGTLETLYPGRIDLGLGRAPGGDSAVLRALRQHGRDGDDFPDLLEELRLLLGDPKPGQRLHSYPGEGTHVPIWLLGSSGYSAQLAGRLGLPFAFAGHFQPGNMRPALNLYRESFRASDVLSKPYCMAGVPVLAADTDEHAHYLATSIQQKFLGLIRNRPIPTQPPVKALDWNPLEREAVDAKLRAAIIGGPETVDRKLEALIEELQVDELILATDAYEPADRLRSFEIVAGLFAASRASHEVNPSASIFPR